jgi:D-glycero-D-manno-heptose 1,7-bisphosphate phosphatase
MAFIILDRDGVINHDPDGYIKSPEEWNPIAGSLEAIARFNRAGFRVLVASNQSGIGRGFYGLDALQRIHEKLFYLLQDAGGKIDEIFFCPHHPDDGCVCRKPSTGMFLEMQAKYGMDFSETYFIGDSIGDVKVAEAVGCVPVLVMTGNGRETLAKHPELMRVRRFEDLAMAADEICSEIEAR